MQISDLTPWGRDKEKSLASERENGSNPLVSLQRDINHVFEDFWNKVENDIKEMVEVNNTKLR